MLNDEQPVEPEEGWILFDGRCGICIWWISIWSSLLRSHGYELTEIEARWVQNRLGVIEGEALGDIRILKTNGEQTIGADVYREVMSRVWWLRPIYFLSICPGSRQVFNLSYQVFKNNRHMVSRMFRMRPY